MSNGDKFAYLRARWRGFMWRPTCGAKTFVWWQANNEDIESNMWNEINAGDENISAGGCDRLAGRNSTPLLPPSISTDNRHMHAIYAYYDIPIWNLQARCKRFGHPKLWKKIAWSCCTSIDLRFRLLNLYGSWCRARRKHDVAPPREGSRSRLAPSRVSLSLKFSFHNTHHIVLMRLHGLDVWTEDGLLRIPGSC